MLSELLSANRPILQKTQSYLLPRLDKIISLVSQLETTAGNDYWDMFERLELRKGSYLLRAGTVCRHYWILEKGIARVFVCINGNEATRYFFFPSEIIDAHGSSSLNIPSTVSIQLLENAVVYRFRKQHFDALKTVYPVLTDIEKLLFDCYTNWIEESIWRIRCLDATAHYQYILQKQPYLLQRISQHHLALYMGISRETLSRIRHFWCMQVMAGCMEEVMK